MLISTNDVEDLKSLTPSHFLTGQIFVPIVEDNHIDTPSNLLRRWQYCMQKHQEVCQRYKSEYLHRLQQRPKWLKPNQNLKIGQLFLIKDDNRNIQQWPLGRIIETHPGSDGLVRVVTLKTQSGLLKRPIHKLSPLPIDDPYTEQHNSVEHNGTIPTVRRSARLKNKMSTHTALALVFCVGFLFAAIDAQSVEQFKHQPGIHFKEEGSVQFTSDS